MAAGEGKMEQGRGGESSGGSGAVQEALRGTHNGVRRPGMGKKSLEGGNEG